MRYFYFLGIMFLGILYKANAQHNVFQKMHLGISGGISQYTGSLPQPDIRAGAGLCAQYEITDQIQVRANLWLSELGASDAAIPNFGRDTRRNDYYFITNLTEVSIMPQYEIFNLNAGKKFTPYVFAGVAMYHYKPYQVVPHTRSDGTLRYYNLAMKKNEYFSNTQIVFPAGVGVKYAFTSNLRIFAEGNYRFSSNKLIDNYAQDNKTDNYYSVQLGILFRLSKNRAGYRIDKSCNCPVY